ncbi:hypothetical protein CJD36_002480 [Flavipsychrobacter stenotrophus]|uniref:ABC-three component systems C-terminal domain-containing protein n=1 Tax=Flavipsychrobacter stenotrophus TaxID=2077091 RepID=A0A2S7T123_9BACT|nr:ABC-three component system protein [Flavipsychrobacter stenotrophus]PQJ12628.1 hypothetical protein CJD36_002480 [Flavipsychrobacter stenotrophus]
MIDENIITVNDTSIGGKFTGRDDRSFNINTLNVRSEYLQELYEKFQKEKENNPELVELCDELDYYNSRLDGDVLGLDEKLTAGNREKIIFYAKSVKEKFHKKLVTTSQYSYIAQDINIWLLAKVKRGFMMEIYTLICNDEPEEKINYIITERIINPVKAELGINLFKYDEEDIMGMIFFLTGNCHLKWN